jgi:hypothetical protein
MSLALEREIPPLFCYLSRKKVIIMKLLSDENFHGDIVRGLFLREPRISAIASCVHIPDHQTRKVNLILIID